MPASFVAMPVTMAIVVACPLVVIALAARSVFRSLKTQKDSGLKKRIDAKANEVAARHASRTA